MSDSPLPLPNLPGNAILLDPVERELFKQHHRKLQALKARVIEEEAFLENLAQSIGTRSDGKADRYELDAGFRAVIPSGGVRE